MGTEQEAKINWRSVCPNSFFLGPLGDKLTMLIMRDLIIFGSCTYLEFLESPEHISINILADRLKLLTSLKLIELTRPEAAARNNAFQLTESRENLRFILEGLGRWVHTNLKDFHADMISLLW